MRPLASIYSHRVPEFMKTQVGFNPIQKGIRILKGNSSRACRLTGRSTDLCHGRPARSTAPTREQSHFSQSTGAGRPLLPVHARARRSTGPVDRPPPSVDRDVDRKLNLPAPCAVSRSFVVRSLCYLLPSPLSPLSQQKAQWACPPTGAKRRNRPL